LQNQAQSSGAEPAVITVSVDEKPGLQAIANTAPDLPPVPGKHSQVGRDMNTNGSAPVRFSRRWICRKAMSPLASKGGIAAANSSRYSKISTNTTRPAAPFASFWTTTRRTSPKKLSPI
jgi:hypothetical protein